MLLNQVILVGKLNSEPEIKTSVDGELGVFINLLVSNSVSDVGNQSIIPIELSDELAINSKEYIAMNMTIGIKGHLEFKNDSLLVIADKITFINTRQDDDID
jgi:single-stranded DNA-binding protein